MFQLGIREHTVHFRRLLGLDLPRPAAAHISALVINFSLTCWRHSRESLARVSPLALGKAPKNSQRVAPPQELCISLFSSSQCPHVVWLRRRSAYHRRRALRHATGRNRFNRRACRPIAAAAGRLAGRLAGVAWRLGLSPISNAAGAGRIGRRQVWKDDTVIRQHHAVNRWS